MIDRFASGLVAGVGIGLLLGFIAVALQYHSKNVVTSQNMIAQAIALCEGHGGLDAMEKDGDLVTYQEIIAICSSGVEISFRSEE